MNLSNLTKVVRFEIIDDGFIFYDEHDNIPNPKNAYWERDLLLYDYMGKSLKGLPKIVNGHLWIMRYTGESLEGLPDVVNGVLNLWHYDGASLKGLPNAVHNYLDLSHYQGNDFDNLPKEYEKIYIKGNWYTKAEFDDYIKTEKLKKVLL